MQDTETKCLWLMVRENIFKSRKSVIIMSDDVMMHMEQEEQAWSSSGLVLIRT